MAQLPVGFTDTDTARSMDRRVVNVIGVVIDTLPSRQTSGSSIMVTFTIKSSDFTGGYESGLKIRYFDTQQQCIPAPNVGDVILIRSLSLRSFNGGIIGLSRDKDATPWMLFKQDSTSRSRLSSTARPGSKGSSSSAETAYVRYLFTAYSGKDVGPIAASPSSSAISTQQPMPPPIRASSNPVKRDKFALIKDAQFNTFIDIVGEVVKTFSDFEKVSLYITDYTENTNLFDYPLQTENHDDDEFRYISRSRREWPGPYGRLTIQVTLWDAHANFARDNVKEKDFVSLRNVHIKFANSGLMEGVLHADRFYPNKIGVTILNYDEPSDYLKQLVQRKLDYARRIKKSFLKEHGKHQLSDSEGPVTKKAKKYKKPSKKKQQISDDGPETATSQTPRKRDGSNPNIRSNYIGVPYRTIEQIIENETHKNEGPGGVEYELPFQCLNYRASIRVIDFFPPNLEDFSVSYNPMRDMLDNASESSSQSSGDEQTTSNGRRWEWRFCLLAEDGIRFAPNQKRNRLKIFVTGADAVCLLGIDPVNLRQRPEVLAALREKLFILWGDLEERKSTKQENFNFNDTDAINTMPFSCCIKEYGVRVASDLNADEGAEEGSSISAWERRFRMFGTTIL